MVIIKSVSCRKILNSHVKFTNEFIIELKDGRRGSGGAPQGETISLYEDRGDSADSRNIIQAVERDMCKGISVDQEGFDAYLQERIPMFGRNNAYALSLAFFSASGGREEGAGTGGGETGAGIFPSICLNILNGGNHAYTNPVLSDFPEYLLVSRSHDPEKIIADHNRIQARVREKLAGQTKILVNGNPVNRFSTPDNRECLDFLRDLLEELDLSADFSLMIDASAGDLWTGESYRLALTDGSSKNSDEFRSYWEEIIRDYQLGFLEDPFQEQDFDRWAGLTRNPDNCRIIGDNLYSSDSGRIREGAERKYTDGTLIKPNQAGTVSAVTAALKAARESGQIAITSHRSISTESTFLSWLTFRHRVEYIKIGPLQSDYSSVIRFNEIIRLTEVRDVD